MVQVGVVTVRVSFEQLDEERMAALGLRLFSAAEDVVLTRLRALTPRVELELEEGSLKVRTRIFAAVGMLATFLSSYGSIREGTEYLAKDVMSASSAVAHKISEVAGVKPKDVLRTVRSATLTRRIRYVVDQVESGNLSADSGAKKIIELLSPDKRAALSPELLQRIRWELEKAHSHILPQVSQDVEVVPAVIIEGYTPTAIAEKNEQDLPSEFPHKPRRIRVFREAEGRGPVRIVEE